MMIFSPKIPSLIPYLFLLSSSAIILSVLHVLNFPPPKHSTHIINNHHQKSLDQPPFAIGKLNPSGCDVFRGSWVMDGRTRPLYHEPDCPYIQPQLTCQEHGRPEKAYQQWRWQPHGCSLPDFNGTLMLEALRGKRMMFVGDSLGRGHYISLVCLLHQRISSNKESIETHGSLTVFSSIEYNATVEFYWAPFLLESNSDDAEIHRVAERVVRKGSIDKHGVHWKGVDILVFNTYLWWVSGLKIKMLEGSFEEGEEKVVEELSTEDAYRLGIKSLVLWIRKNVDGMRSRVFFTTMSPTHSRSIYWGRQDRDGNCYNETHPIANTNYRRSDLKGSIMDVIAEEFGKSDLVITILNITQLSDYRKDAHTSIYKRQWSPLTTQQLSNPTSYADCIHWCLPGLQDSWNELLFTKLFYT